MAKNKRKDIVSILRGLWASFASGKGNAKTILLCLVTAFIFWFFNSLNKEYSTRLAYPITFDFNRDSLICKNKLPSQISINVTGGGWNLLRKTIGFSVKPIVIDLKEVPNQSFLTEYSLMSLVGDQLDELTVNYIISDTIFIDIDQKSKKTLKLNLDTTKVSLAENYLITSEVSFSPDTISISGPKSFLDEYHGTLNLLLPDSEIDENYNERIPVSLSIQPSITSIPDRVDVQFDVEKFVNKTSNLKIERQNFPTQKVKLLSSASAEVDFYLPVAKANQLDTTAIKAIADYDNFNPADSSIQLKLNEVPTFIRSYHFINPSVKVIYQ